MPSQGPNSPTTAASDTSVGSLDWNDTGSAAASDNTYATATLASSGTAVTYYLRASRFQFAIPSGATIDGVGVEFERKANHDGNLENAGVTDSSIRLVKSLVATGNNKADANYWSTSESYVSYGGAADLWGATLSPADVNSTGFGVALSVTLASDGIEFPTASVDHVRITIHYTESEPDHEYTGTGGLEFGGAAPTNLNDNDFTAAGSGGLEFSGTAQANFLDFQYIGEGGLDFSGAAATQITRATYQPFGGLVLGGHAIPRLAVVGTGGLSFTGTAKIKYGPQPSGGLTINGQGLIVFDGWNGVVSGGLTIQGAATAFVPEWITPGDGGLTFSGTSQASGVSGHWIVAGIGGLTFSNTSPTKIGKRAVPVGGMHFEGEAEPELAISYTPTGGLTFSGEAVWTIHGTHLTEPPVFDNAFRYRKRITIPASSFGSDLSDFPVVVVATLDDQQLRYKAQGTSGLFFSGTPAVTSAAWQYIGDGSLILDADTLILSCGNRLGVEKAFSATVEGGCNLGGTAPARYADARDDICFEGACGHTVYPHEIESFDAVSGQLVAWVKLPSIVALEDTDFYLYYGGDAGSPLDVWDSYESVYHLGTLTDSTGNNDLTAPDVTSLGTNPAPQPIDTLIADGRRFDGNDHLTATDSINETDSLTIEGWIKPTRSVIARQVFYSRGQTDFENGYGWSLSVGIDEQSRAWAQVQATCNGEWQTVEVIGETAISVNQWSHIAAVWTSGESLTLYLNGEQDGETETTYSSLVPYSGTTQLGRRDNRLNIFADLDEVRVSRLARTSAWIKATYDGSVDPEFTDAGPQEHAFHLWGCPVVRVDRAISGSGPLTLAGSAAAKVPSFFCVPQGGLELAGGYRLSERATGSGGLELTSTAPSRIGGFRGSVSGGLTFSANPSPKVGRRVSGTGAVRFGSSGAVKLGRLYTPTGQLRIRGSSDSEVDHFIAAGSGGLAFAGSSQPERTEGGSITLAGSAAVSGHTQIASSGILRFAGTAGVSRQDQHAPSGQLRLRSSATVSYLTTHVTTGDGSLTLSGESQPLHYVGGILTLSSSGIAKINRTLPASGTLRLGSSAPTHQVKAFATSGRLLISGAYTLRRATTGNGGLEFDGSSTAKIGYGVVGGCH